MTTVKKVKAKSKPVAHKPVKKAAPAKKSIKKPAHTIKATRSVGESAYMDYSGKFTVRLPRSLHQALVERAEKEGVSLNLFVTNALSRTVAVPSSKKH